MPWFWTLPTWSVFQTDVQLEGEDIDPCPGSGCLSFLATFISDQNRCEKSSICVLHGNKCLVRRWGYWNLLSWLRMLFKVGYNLWSSRTCQRYWVFCSFSSKLVILGDFSVFVLPVRSYLERRRWWDWALSWWSNMLGKVYTWLPILLSSQCCADMVCMSMLCWYAGPLQAQFILKYLWWHYCWQWWQCEVVRECGYVVVCVCVCGEIYVVVWCDVIES